MVSYNENEQVYDDLYSFTNPTLNSKRSIIAMGAHTQTVLYSCKDAIHLRMDVIKATILLGLSTLSECYTSDI